VTAWRQRGVASVTRVGSNGAFFLFQGAFMHKFLASAIVATACFVAGCGAGSASPVGLWLAKDGGKVRIGPCGRNLCGFLVQPPAGAAAVNKRGRPTAGMEVLISMRRDGLSKWSGHVYNDDDGKTYEGHLIENDASSIRIEGCWLGICGGENLTRIR
jgi:uncharacterized protein (DUF2147 family)